MTRTFTAHKTNRPVIVFFHRVSPRPFLNNVHTILKKHYCCFLKTNGIVWSGTGVLHTRNFNGFDFKNPWWIAVVTTLATSFKWTRCYCADVKAAAGAAGHQPCWAGPGSLAAPTAAQQPHVAQLSSCRIMAAQGEVEVHDHLPEPRSPVPHWVE